jgi:DNA polymerase
MPDNASASRQAYLKAMGIDVWLDKNSDRTENLTELEHIPVAVDAPIKPVETKSAEITPVIIPETKPSAIIKPCPEVNSLDWQSLRSRVSGCRECSLAETRTQTVFGSGNKQASLMLISDAPDQYEDAQGEPFVAETGKLLTAMLKAIGFNLQDVYISNITKCQPPKNREPSIEESESCWPYLKRQIDLVQPDLILALGLTAAQRLLNTKSTLSRLRGQPHFVENISIPVLVSYHPAYLLRSPSEKRKAWDDLKLVMQYLAKNKE